MSEVKISKDLENKKLVIEFAARGSKEKVWQAYADKETFEKWWGPEGWKTTTKSFSLTPGGKIHYGMECIDESQTDWFGKTAWGVMDVLEVNPKDSFTYMDYFSDEEGTLSTEMPVLKITNEFFEKDGTTQIVSTSFADSTEQIEQLINMGMAEGVTSQLNKLDALFL